MPSAPGIRRQSSECGPLAPLASPARTLRRHRGEMRHVASRLLVLRTGRPAAGATAMRTVVAAGDWRRAADRCSRPTTGGTRTSARRRSIRAVAAVHRLHRHGGTPRCIPTSAAIRVAGSRASTASPTWSSAATSPSARCTFYYAGRERRRRSATGELPFYPIPDEAITQPSLDRRRPARATSDPGGDRHMLIVDRDNRHLYELFDLALERHAMDGRLGRVLRSQRATTAGPTGGRRPTPPAWPSCPGWCATTRSSGRTRSATRFA